MRGINAATLAALGQPVVRMAFLALVEFPAPNRIAFTTLTYDFEHEGDTFVAAGNLGAVTEVASDSQVSPANYAISLSGINPDILQAAAIPNYMNHEATVWAMTVDRDYQIIGEPFIWFRGLTDSVNIDYGKLSSVTINVRDRAVDWQRPRISRYTDYDQKRNFPNDRGFEYVTQIASREVEWPADTWFEKNA